MSSAKPNVIRYPGSMVGTQVIAAQDAGGVDLHLFDEPGGDVHLPAETVAKLFSLGLRTPADENDSVTVPLGELDLHDERTRFMVGEQVIPHEVGLDAVARGVVAALVAAQAARDDSQGEAPPPSVRASAQEAGTEPLASPDAGPGTGAATSGDDEPRLCWVEVDEDASELGDVLDRTVETGEHIVVSRNGTPIAVLVPFDWYRATREQQARLEVAHWAAWKGGAWDPESYAANAVGADSSHREVHRDHGQS